MLDAFAAREVKLGRARVHVRTGGNGPPLLLLHGFPQTHLCWHRIADALAARHTLVMPDVPGYGRSPGPAADGGAAAYSKRALAADMVELMAALGHDTFDVAGHDRGGRIAYRLALDAPERVERLVLLDILPTGVMWERMSAEAAVKGFHWLLLAQPAPLPERIIAADPDHFIGSLIDRWCATPGAITPAARVAYLEQYHEARVIEAACEDYRAGFGPDRAHDDATRADGRRIAAPVLVLSGARYMPDPEPVWRDWCVDVRAVGLDCGHFIAEEKPEETAGLMLSFLKR